MKKILAQHVFLVESPLQALNAIAIIGSKKLESYEIVIAKNMALSKQRNNEQIDSVLSNVKATKKRNFFSSSKKIRNILNLWQLGKALNEVEHIYIGDFRSNWMHDVANLARIRKIAFMDDGAATISIKNEYLDKGVFYPFKKQDDFKKLIKRKVFSRRNKTDVDYQLFTTFPIEKIENVEIKKIDYSCVTSSPLPFIQRERDVIFFGSKYSESGIISSHNEVKNLKRVQEYFSNRNRIIYVPHRADSQEKIQYIENILGFSIQPLEYPAEMYINKINDDTILAGFYSTVLVNAKCVFKKEKIISFRLNPDDIDTHFIDRIDKAYTFYKNKCNLKVV